MRFDWKSIRHACGEDGLVLTMGYNTAIFNLLFRLKRIPNIINMDGLEWKRSKWGIAAKLWFYINEWAGCFIGNHLIADHPEIERRISRKRSKNAITMIPYGAEQIESCSDKPVIDLGLTPKSYALCVARPEPENSILEIVRAFSCSHRNFKLVVLGDFQSHNNRYHASILEAASDEVLFPGALYEVETVQSLRSHCRLYVHGHTVGGTNPSLVESLAAGAPILAHDNVFNRWVAGDEQVYFSNEKVCKKQLDELLVNDERLGKMSAGSLKRAEEAFAWSYILSKYENLLGRLAPPIQT
jgi:glycosyltransferase involved in cell wall biosynthesis